MTQLVAPPGWPPGRPAARRPRLGAHRRRLAARHLPAGVPVLPRAAAPRRGAGPVRGAARRGLPGGGAARPQRGPVRAARRHRPGHRRGRRRDLARGVGAADRPSGAPSAWSRRRCADGGSWPGSRALGSAGMRRLSVVLLVDAPRLGAAPGARRARAARARSSGGWSVVTSRTARSFEPAAYRELEEETGVRLRRRAAAVARGAVPVLRPARAVPLPVWTAPTTLTDADIVVGEGRQIVFVDPADVPLLDSQRVVHRTSSRRSSPRRSTPTSSPADAAE